MDLEKDLVSNLKSVMEGKVEGFRNQVKNLLGEVPLYVPKNTWFIQGIRTKARPYLRLL